MDQSNHKKENMKMEEEANETVEYYNYAETVTTSAVRKIPIIIHQILHQKGTDPVTTNKVMAAMHACGKSYFR
jgi:hypothetical protein